MYKPKMKPNPPMAITSPTALILWAGTRKVLAWAQWWTGATFDCWIWKCIEEHGGWGWKQNGQSAPWTPATEEEKELDAHDPSALH